jgi:predicted enzyme related to lactoylglutathione lyase
MRTAGAKRPTSAEERPMKVTQVAIRLNSPNPSRLRAFYREVVGLTTAPELGDGMFRLADHALLDIDAHAEVEGAAGEPSRQLLELGVMDVTQHRQRIAARGAQFVREEEAEAGGREGTTLIDPDGNFVRLMQRQR